MAQHALDVQLTRSLVPIPRCLAPGTCPPELPHLQQCALFHLGVCWVDGAGLDLSDSYGMAGGGAIAAVPTALRCCCQDLTFYCDHRAKGLMEAGCAATASASCGRGLQLSAVCAQRWALQLRARVACRGAVHGGLDASAISCAVWR